MSTALVRFDAARMALAEARNIDEVKAVRDKAEALRLYARQAGESLEMQNDIAEIKLRAERRAGELLRDVERAQGARTNITSCHRGRKFKDAIADARISERSAYRWQAIADVPEPVFEQHIETVKARGDELTSAGVLRIAQEQKRNERRQEMVTRPIPTGRFRVVYADPPWAYDNSGFTSSAEQHYPTMPADKIAALPVQDLCDESAVLFLWATSPLLPEALMVMDAWGFTYKASMVWDKQRAPGLGWWLKTRHELLLIGAKAATPQPRVKQDSIISIASTQHSAKPEEFATMIEQMFDGPYIELFARRARRGWEVWGNEV